MKKFSMLGIVGSAALLAAVPLSLQWSQVGSAVPQLTVSHANAQYLPQPKVSHPHYSGPHYRGWGVTSKRSLAYESRLMHNLYRTHGPTRRAYRP